jgi:FkbM family methyltransferase
MADWIWRSLEQRAVCDDRFSSLGRRLHGEFGLFFDAPAPAWVYYEHVSLYQALKRLQNLGYDPDFVLDVGASCGVWSHTANGLFPGARFVLVDPLLQQYPASNRRAHIEPHRNFETVVAAVADYCGETSFQIAHDLTASSLLMQDSLQLQRTIKTQVTTVDALADRLRLKGRGLLKIDVQYAEHLVLAGAAKLLGQVDVLILELSIRRNDPRARVFREMLELVEGLDFVYHDEMGCWRSPSDGRLLEKDVLFVRRGLFEQATLAA